MAKEPSRVSNNTSSPSPSSTADSYIGSFISVTSKCEIRYEGVLYYLNPQDSTFGLKGVRSFGTEGRNKTGQQVPPSDKVYEYILFRGCDIKDLRVITSPPIQIEEPIFNDPAIIQSNSRMGPPSSSASVSSAYNSYTESSTYNTHTESSTYNTHTESSASNTRSYAITPPSQFSGTQFGIWGSSQSTHNSAPSYVMPTQWTAYSGAGGGIYSASNLSNNVLPGDSSRATSSSIFFTASPTLASEQPPTHLTDSFSLKPTYFPFPHPTFINSNGLTMPLSSTENQFNNKVAPDPAHLLPTQSAPNYMLSVSDPISDPQQRVFLTPNLSKPILSEHSLAKTLYPDQKDISVMSSTSMNFSSSFATPEVQLSLLPLPPSSQKLQSMHFDEEFDFQAMNERFKKDEVWRYLGKSNQREKVEGIQGNRTSMLEPAHDNPEIISTTDPKPAYKKDDFFDTISCNSVGRGARNGQNQLSERMKLDSQTFGSFQRGNQYGYGGHRGGGRGDHHGPPNWRRGYNSCGNMGGRGGYVQR